MKEGEEAKACAAEIQKSEAGDTAGLESCTPEQIQDLDCPSLFLNRELNWLEFNGRVLECALDDEAPLLEQLKFLTIFYTNLDEFFMVRVANVFRLYRSGSQPTGDDKMSAARQLAEIRRRVMHMTSIAQEHWRKKLSGKLRDKGISIVHFNELSEKQRRFLSTYFNNEIYPTLTPQAMDPTHPFPTISNVSLNFIIQLRDEKGEVKFARLRCPGNVPRIIFVPKSQEKSCDLLGLSSSTKDSDILLVEELVQEYLPSLFPGYTIENVGLFRITRNTDLEIEEDEADDLLEAVKDLVDQRRFGDVIRLETAHGMPAELSEFLMKKLHLRPFQVYRVKGPLAFSALMALYSVDRPALKIPPHPGRIPSVFTEDGNAIFERIRHGDLFVHHPYDSFKPVLDFVHNAAVDPRVIAIKQTLYRCGNNSPIVQSLIEARRRGKQVTAVVELKARFDEERNITWAEELEKAGVNVVYGIVGMKIHAKLCLVVRREEQGVVRYAHVGTGNYNASTAKIYTDMGIFTANQDVCQDITDLFNVMTGYAVRKEYRSLLVSPVSMRHGLISHIQKEVELHKKQGGGEIILKCNQLVDKKIIKELYRASMAGVRVRLIIRGICCLRPGVPGISDNITVTSIVGRFLEHVRVYWFRNGGDGIMYIGSADIMPRNLDRRIEVLIPVSNGEIRRHIREYVLDRQLRDNMQSWHMCPDGTYKRVHLKDGEEPVNAQEMLLDDEPFIPAPER